jgi:glucose/arabinose dehydrogenase
VTRLAALLAAFAALASAGCGGDEPDRRQTPGTLARGDALRLEVVARGLEAPLQALPLPGSSTGELAVVEQGGTVRILPGRRVLLDLRDRVSVGGERGLLSIAFHPDFPADRRLYASFTDHQGDSRVVEIGQGSERELIRVDQPYENHNGGHILFGPDRLLYLGLGDGGDAFDPEQRSQDPSMRLGKLLRTNVDAGEPEWEMVALGLRNPWRFSFDPATGDLWIGDVGQDLWEEVDVVRGGPGALLNFGWDVFEGGERVEAHELGPGRLVSPVAVYGHDLGCSVTGGHVLEQGPLAGRYVYGDFCSGRIFSLRARDAGDARLERIRVPQLTSFGRDADGRLLFVSASGRILRLAS